MATADMTGLTVESRHAYDDIFKAEKRVLVGRINSGRGLFAVDYMLKYYVVIDFKGERVTALEGRRRDPGYVQRG